MAYTNAQAQQQVLDSLATATEELGYALADLGEAYELLDEGSADNLEAELFRPVQRSYGRAKRTHGEFAERHGLPGRDFEPARPGAPSHRAAGFLDSGVEHVARADTTLATLQDSMLPIEVGDAELRAGLEEVRTLISGLTGRANRLRRTIGR